jgi:hypothetical protein
VNRLARWLVGLYPGAWRERYEDEFVAMLEQRRASPSDLGDVALGALDAWVRPQVASVGRRTLVISKMRSSLLAVFWAWVGFVVAGVGFQKMIEYEDFVGRRARTWWWASASRRSWLAPSSPWRR